MEANASERRRWNDLGWVAVWTKRERLTDEVTPFLVEALALQPHERVLDIGSGGGKTTIAAARAVGPDGVAVGADISAPLSALATERAANAQAENVTFRVADLQRDKIAGGPFDVAMSQFGVMFFDDPVAAFTNIRTQLGSGGRIAFACWRTIEQNPWHINTVLAGIVPPPPPLEPGKSLTGPFALGDPDRTRGILEAAGFVDIRRSVHDLLPEVPLDAVVDETQLTFLGVPPDRMDTATAAVNAHLATFQTRPGWAKLPLAFQIFQATAH
jgi:SAM-dependent methyltransferase